MKEHKSFQFEIKSGDLNEDGTFTGLASTYGNVDQGDDIVIAGAFTKTLQERGNKLPILWSHKTDKPIGRGSLEDSDSGLVVKGELNLELQEARDVYSNLKMGIVKGLSIGFETVKRNIKDGIRHLTELKLYEVSLCVFPMNEMATVQTVKTESQDLQDAIELGEKVGRRHSAATQSRLSAIAAQQAALAQEIQALLSVEAAADPSTSDDGAATPEVHKTKANTIEPEAFHSLMSSFSTSLIGELKWQK